MPASATRRQFIQASGAAALSAASYARVCGASERLGLGLIGYGLIAQTHLRIFRRLPQVEFRGVCDVHQGRRDEGAQSAGEGVPAYADFRKLLDQREVDAVIVATPDHWHALMTMLACAAGKDVYVEKPLTLFVKEGEWMERVAARTQRVVQVGTQQRSGAHYARARSLIRSGHIGQVTSVRMRAIRNVFPGFGRPADSPPPPQIDYDAWLGPAPARPYNPNRCLYHFRWFWDYSGGQLTNLGAHHLDIVDWFLGLEGMQTVTSVGGRYALQDNGETPDTQDVLWDCGRFSVAFEMREAAAGEKAAFGLTFYGTRGSLSIDRRGFTITPDMDIPAANLVPGVKGGHPVGGPQAVPLPAEPKPRTEAIQDTSGSSDEQYLAHARNFIDCIRSRALPISDLASAQRTALACHLGNLSLRLGRSLRWDAKTASIRDDAEANAALVRPYRAPWDRELQALAPEK